MEVNNYYLHQPLDTLTIEKGDHQQQTLCSPTVSSNTILLQKKIFEQPQPKIMLTLQNWLVDTHHLEA